MVNVYIKHQIPNSLFCKLINLGFELHVYLYKNLDIELNEFTQDLIIALKINANGKYI